MAKGKNMLPNTHLRKHWQTNVKTWFNQPARKQRRLIARREKAAALFPRPLEKLRPIVRGQTNRYNKRQRVGRGFTLEEIKAAGLGVAFARSIGIAVDHRRKNKSVEAFQINVQRLKAYKERLVLFPRTEGKPKKGLINDATADTIKGLAVQQNDEKVLFSIPEVPLREKPLKLTQELRDRKVYRELRQEWVNEYYYGKRQKKAQEAEAK